jgi:glycerol-3-phosphate cytidylyltransferase
MTEEIAKKVGLFPMCVDILHVGHILALEEAKKHYDVLIVALNTHPDGKNPIQSVFERYMQLSAVKWVDKIIPYQGKADMERISLTLDYQIRFLGEDYIDKEWDGKVQEQKCNIKSFFINRKHEFSSSELKKRIEKLI